MPIQQNESAERDAVIPSVARRAATASTQPSGGRPRNLLCEPGGLPRTRDGRTQTTVLEGRSE